MTKVTDVIVHHVHLSPNAERAAYRLVLVEVETESGVTGVGEVGLAYGIGAVGAMQVVLEMARNYLIGHDARAVARFSERVYRNGFWLQGGGPVMHGAVSALDQALWDIKGKLLGAPVYELLGGAMRERIRLYCNGWSRSIGTIGGLAERAAEEAEKGYTALKFDPFKYDAAGARTALVGAIEPALHRLGVERVRAVREAIGPDVDILIELHGNLMPTDALRACRDMAEFRPFFFEEPIDCSDVGVLADFAARVATPLAAGERIYTNSGFRPYLESGALAVIQPDMGLCGGITELMRIAGSAQAHQVKVQPHNCGGPVSTAACLQVDAVIPNLQFQEIFPYFADGRQEAVTAAYERRLVDGYLGLPDGPGLGIEINHDYLKGHASSLRASA
jgi:galactonate dehydratase